MNQSTWEKRAYMGVVIFMAGIAIVLLGIGRAGGFNVIALGFGYLISAYWKKTHPDIKEVVAERENQKNRIAWRSNLKRKINSSEIENEEIAIQISDEAEIE